MRSSLKRLPLLVPIAIMATAASVHAQDNAGLTGIVTDTTGAVISDTEVTLTNPLRGLRFTAKTNSEGNYRFPNVPPAQSYRINFSHAGFVSTDLNEVSLAVGITQTQNVTLTAGTAQAVEVTTKNALVTINTTDASIGNNFDVELINDLPVQNRNSPAALFTLQPGVNAAGSVTGARTDQTSVTVDGMDANDLSTGQFGNVNGGLPVDATQEFRGTVAGLPSNLGTGSGGQFQLITKSGTNRFHGLAYEYHRDTITTANTWFNNIAVPQVSRPALIQNQFGGNFGGPILRDKAFVFVDFNNSRIIANAAGADTVPLDTFRAGNIGYVNNNAGCLSNSRVSSAPNCISYYTPAQVAALDPAKIGDSPTLLALYASRYPSANDLTGGDGINTGLFRFTQKTLYVLYNGVARVDYNLTSKQRIFLQYHDSHQDSVQAVNRFPNDPLTRPFQDRSYGYVGSIVSQIGNNKVNQFYYGSNTTVFSFALAFNPNGTTYINSTGPITAPYDGGNIQRRRVPVPEFRDDFNWTIGNHNISFGGSFKAIKASNLLINDYNFYTLGLGGNLTTLNAALRPANILATTTTNTTQFDTAFAFALGRVGRVTSNYNYNNAAQQTPQGAGANRRYRYYQTEAYAGDTWKVKKNLTVTYGLRYSLYSVPYETLGAESIPGVTTFNDYFSTRVRQTAAGNFGATSVGSGSNAVPLLQYSLGGVANNKPGYYQNNPLDFAPRFAVAYNPMERTVFNASANLVYDRTVANAINFIQNQSTYLFQNTVVQNYGNSANVAGSLATDPRIGSTLLSLPAPPNVAAPTSPYTPNVSANGTPTGLISGLGTTIIDANLKDPYSIEINAGVQQEFGHGFILRANYVNRMGRRLLGQADASQLIDTPDPQSGQMLSQAFAYATTATRNGVLPTQLTAQPFFEHVLTPNTYVGKSCGRVNGVAVTCNSNTAYAAYNQSTYINLGDITDTLQAFASQGILPTNAGLGSQFSRATFYTNKGFSNYNGLLLTLSKNLQNGTKFDFNYTYSKSIDNVSIVANSIASGTGFICDVTRPRACRGPSDFDNTHVISADFITQLPVGHGRRFASNVPWYVNELIGGWDLSGIPRYQSGLAYTTSTSAYLAGFANNDPAILDNRFTGDIALHKHKNASNQLVAFTDVNATKAHFRGPVGIEYGSRNPLRAPSQFYFDAGLAKSFELLPDNRLRLKFRADAFNVLNHPTFAAPTSAITSASFGVISATTVAPRQGQFSLRLEF